MHACMQCRSKRCRTLSSHQWALTAVRPVCCLADLTILNAPCRLTFFFFLPLLSSFRQPHRLLLGLSMQGLAGVWVPRHKRSTQVPIRDCIGK